MGDFNNNNVCQYAERLFFSAGNNSICHGLKPYSIFVKILFKIYEFCTFHGFVLDISVAKSGNKLLSNIQLYWVVYIYGYGSPISCMFSSIIAIAWITQIFPIEWPWIVRIYLYLKIRAMQGAAIVVLHLSLESFDWSIIYKYVLYCTIYCNLIFRC